MLDIAAVNLATRSLSVKTWPDFAALAEDHQVFGMVLVPRLPPRGRSESSQCPRRDSPARWGLIESYPEDTSGRRVSGSFLYNGTQAMFERHGFERGRQLGKHCWVMTRRIV